MAVTINGTTGINTPGVTNTGAESVTSTSTVGALVIGSNNISATNSLGFRNRIINGDMRIDQRNAGGVVTPTSDVTYTLDRWVARLGAASKFSVTKSNTSTTGFPNSLLVTSLAATSVAAGDFYAIGQYIEGLNVADLAWGTANAQTITISFWVRSSLTGTFGGAIRNLAGNRSYPFTFTINSANTFEYKTITVAGDTTGTWPTDNTAGIQLYFGLGMGSTYSGTAGAWTASAKYTAAGATSVVGTSGATFYITGVQLEAGSVATPFERRAYGTELALCQRYYQQWGNGQFFGSGVLNGTTNAYVVTPLSVNMRATPTATTTLSNIQLVGASLLTPTSIANIYGVGNQSVGFSFTTSGATAGQATTVYTNTTTFGLSAEL